MSQRAFNAPPVILVLMGMFAAIHLVVFFLGDAVLGEVRASLAFIPARYSLFFAGEMPFQPEMLWTPVTYAFLHGDFMHLLVNTFWLLVFGSPLAWRFGLWRFLVFSALCSVFAAALHGVFNAGSLIPVVGASGAISGHTGAALRFAFSRQGLGHGPMGPHLVHQQEALTIGQMCRNQTVVLFFTFWLLSNLMVAGFGSGVAWIAHIGGFMAGVFLFPLFDPVRPQPPRFRVIDNGSWHDDDAGQDDGRQH